MKKQQLALLFLLLLAATLWSRSSNAAGLGPDVLYVGDTGDRTPEGDLIPSTNTVKGFRIQDGKVVFEVKQDDTGRLIGPTGLLIAGSQLIVVNQHISQDPNFQPNGEILQYQLKDASFAGAWVSSSDQDAPLAPRGAALKDGVLYVANLVDSNDGDTPGEVWRLQETGI